MLVANRPLDRTDDRVDSAIEGRQSTKPMLPVSVAEYTVGSNVTTKSEYKPPCRALGSVRFSILPSDQ